MRACDIDRPLPRMSRDRSAWRTSGPPEILCSLRSLLFMPAPLRLVLRPACSRPRLGARAGRRHSLRQPAGPAAARQTRALAAFRAGSYSCRERRARHWEPGHHGRRGVEWRCCRQRALAHGALAAAGNARPDARGGGGLPGILIYSGRCVGRRSGAESEAHGAAAWHRQVGNTAHLCRLPAIPKRLASSVPCCGCHREADRCGGDGGGARV